MALNMTRDNRELEGDASNKLSARMSVFAWIICAVIGWALTFTSLTSLSDNDNELSITAQNEPSLEDAANLEKILPAAGPSQK